MSVPNKTYNNVVNTILRMGEYHEQISTTSVGDIWDIDLEKMTKFPLLHVNPTTVSTGDSQLVYNFQIFIMDMVTERANWDTNRSEIVSASQDEFTKLVKTLSNEQDVYNDTLQIVTEPFQERFDNLCCGWVFQIGVLVQNDFQTCNIPVENTGAGY